MHLFGNTIYNVKHLPNWLGAVALFAQQLWAIGLRCGAVNNVITNNSIRNYASDLGMT